VRRRNKCQIPSTTSRADDAADDARRLKVRRSGRVIVHHYINKETADERADDAK
jgi:hypothetical protein